MEKTFIMSVKKKYEVHVTTDLNCKEVYIPAKRNKTNLEKLFEDLVSIPIYPIYLLYMVIYENYHELKVFRLLSSIFGKIDKFMNYLYKIVKLGLCLLFVGSYFYGMFLSQPNISLFVSIISLLMTCSLGSRFEWIHLDLCIAINALIAIGIYLGLIHLSPHITLNNCFQFLTLGNLGNTLSYISFIIAIIDLIISKQYK